MRRLHRGACFAWVMFVLCSVVATGCKVGAPPSGDSGDGSAKGTAGEFFYLGIFRPTGGTITSLDGRIKCGVEGDLCGNSAYQTRYEWNEVATLSAKEAPGYRFDGWAGDCSGTGDCIISTATKRADSYVVAVFTPEVTYPNTYFVVNVQQPVGGTIRTLGSAHIECGPEGSSATRCGPAVFPWNGSVTLTAEAGPHYVFLEWTGDCTGDAPTCVLENVTVDKRIGARFGLAADLPELVWDSGNWDQVRWQ